MKIEGKKSRVTQFPPHLHLPVCQPSSSNEFTFSDLPFLAHTPIEALFIILCIYCKFSSIHTLAFLIPSLHNWAVPLHSSYDVPASTACVLPFCPLVWPAGFDSSVLVSCLPFLISYTRGLRALALYGKCLKVLFCSLVPEGCFPGHHTVELLEELEVCFPKIQDPDFSFCLTLRTTNSSCLKTVCTRVYYWLWITESAVGCSVRKRESEILI